MTAEAGQLTREVWRADAFFGLLLYPLCCPLWGSGGLDVLMCALLADLPARICVLKCVAQSLQTEAAEPHSPFQGLHYVRACVVCHCFLARAWPLLCDAPGEQPASLQGPLSRPGLPFKLLNTPHSTTLLIMQVGGAVHGILLGPTGGLAYVGRDKSPARDLFVVICGPLTHVLQACPPRLRAAPVHACL